jgi:hypothetical protein
MDGLSAPMHKSEKIWFMYPPTKKNLSIIGEDDGQVVPMVSLSQSLEGGVMFYTSSETAVYIPSGCIHGSVTVSGGFLVTMDFTTKTSVLPFSRYLNFNLYSSLDQEGQRDCFYMFLDSLNVALVNGRHNLAIRCWITIENCLRRIAMADQEWRVAAAACWDSFLTSGMAHGTTCPCGVDCHEADFGGHFQSTHLKLVHSEDVHRRSTGRTR